MGSSRRSTTRTIIPSNPLPIFPADDLFNPTRIAKIPLHRLANTGMKGFPGRPSEFGLQLRAIDGISPIVARAVFHIGNQTIVWRSHRMKFIENCAKDMYDVQILLLIQAAYVIGLAEFSFFQHC